MTFHYLDPSPLPAFASFFFPLFAYLRCDASQISKASQTQMISPAAHKHQKLLLTANMPSRGTKYIETRWVQEGSTVYIGHDGVWNCLGRNGGFPFQPVPAKPSVATDESPESQIMSHKSVFLSCTSSKYCSETSHSPSAPVSCTTNQRELWQSASYTPTLAASLDRYKWFPFLGQEVKTKHTAGGICPRGKSFLPTKDSYITFKRRCVTGMS